MGQESEVAEPGHALGRGIRRAGVALAVLTVLLVAVAGWAAVPRDDELPTDIDAVVALGGGSGRVQLAREIAATHDAQLVLSATSIDVGQREGLACGVDALCLDPDPHSTIGEARGMAALAVEHSWDTVSVATSQFHTNRSRLVFRQCLDQVAVVGAHDLSAPVTFGRQLRELVGMLASLTVRRAC